MTKVFVEMTLEQANAFFGAQQPVQAAVHTQAAAPLPPAATVTPAPYVAPYTPPAAPQGVQMPPPPPGTVGTVGITREALVAKVNEYGRTYRPVAVKAILNQFGISSIHAANESLFPAIWDALQRPPRAA